MILSTSISQAFSLSYSQFDWSILSKACAYDSVVIIVCVCYHIAGRPDCIKRESNDHLGRLGFLGHKQFSSVLVLVVNTDGIFERQLPNLFNRLESQVVCLELVGETGGLGAELPRYVPSTLRKPLPVEPLHRVEVGTLPGIHLVGGHQTQQRGRNQ